MMRKMENWIEILSLAFSGGMGIAAVLGLSYYLQNKSKAKMAFSRAVIFTFATIAVIAVLSIILIGHQTFSDLVGSIVGFFGTLSTLAILIIKLKFW